MINAITYHLGTKNTKIFLGEGRFNKIWNGRDKDFSGARSRMNLCEGKLVKHLAMHCTI